MEKLHWNKKEIAFLKKSFLERKTDKKIAEELGRTINAIRGKARRLNLRKNKQWTKEEIEKLKNLYPKGIKYNNLVKQINHPLSSIFSKAFDLGIRRKEKINKSVKIGQIGEKRQKVFLIKTHTKL